ncbi:MAG TPA: ATP-binding cassette domain-containing protein [Candidatus Korarchaeota archaeon]|nr:ATP-binding cassette domain-containing protein [Candidatus Korarchaeota archaeon]
MRLSIKNRRRFTDMQSVISIRNLTYTYPTGVKALKGINLEIERGEYVVIMGANGAGKTTLCYCLNGIIPHIIGGELQGEVYVEGNRTTDHSIAELSRLVGLCIQNPEGQLFCQTVRADVAFGAENLCVPRDELAERVASSIKVCRLEGLENRSPSDLSGGQKQRVALASILAMRPRVMVLDEPTSQLDPIGTSELLSVVRNLNKEHGVTVVMTEHKSDEILEQEVDRVILLHKGEIVADGDPGEVLSKADLLEKIGVKTPQVIELARRLKRNGIPVEGIPTNINEARKLLSSLLDRKILEVKQKLPPPSSIEESKPSSEEPIIKIEDVYFSYTPESPAIRGVSLQFHSGEFVGIIGQNGSGKTTLAKLTVGLLRPDRGRILIFGKDTREMTPGEICKKVGLAMQNPDHQLFSLSVKEEVEFGLRNLNLPEEEIERRTESALKLVGLWEFRDMPPFTLDFGARRKLTVAIVTAMDPPVIFLDEPTTAQDYRGRYEIMEIMKDLNERHGKTVIVVTHDMEIVAKYCKRVVVMGQGKVLLDGSTREVFSKPEILEQTFIKPPPITRLAQGLSAYGIPPSILSVDELISSLKFEGG